MWEVVGTTSRSDSDYSTSSCLVGSLVGWLVGWLFI